MSSTEIGEGPAFRSVIAWSMTCPGLTNVSKAISPGICVNAGFRVESMRGPNYTNLSKAIFPGCCTRAISKALILEVLHYRVVTHQLSGAHSLENTKETVKTPPIFLRSS